MLWTSALMGLSRGPNRQEENTAEDLTGAATELADSTEHALDLAHSAIEEASRSGTILTLLYLIAAVLFILSLGGLSKHETARRGNLFGIIGILLSVFGVMIFGDLSGGHIAIWIALAAGAAIGIVIAQRVQMTSMPQLVAILHSFVGLAAVLVGLSNQLAPCPCTSSQRTIDSQHRDLPWCLHRGYHVYWLDHRVWEIGRPHFQ